MAPTLAIPSEILPSDPRFGSGPSRVRAAQIDAIRGANSHAGRDLILGTSHRQAPVKDLVASIQGRLADLFSLPEGHQVVLGNGGASAFWMVATTSLVRRCAAHAVFGEFGAKFADHTARAPFLDDPIITQAEPGRLATVTAAEVDTYAWPHHETSTGVISPVEPVAGAVDALTVVDATSIAGGVEVDLRGIDAYYFAGQKCLGSDGGLWMAFISPRAAERARELADQSRQPGSTRWMPDLANLALAIDNSARHQTVNTPALATLVMIDEQLRWMESIGGLAACAKRSRTSSDLIYKWAGERDFARPFVAEPQWRSPVVATIDFDGVDAKAISAVLRDNGIVDVDPYRKLGRNQLRIATFPSVDAEDVERLLACIDWVVEALG